MVTVYDATFARPPTGELMIVLSVDNTRRLVMVGTRRQGKISGHKYATVRMFVDSLVFQCGTVIEDGSGQQVGGGEYWYWYGPWVCEGDNWQLYDEYFNSTGKSYAVGCEISAS
jgi:hypothetical protein